MRAAAERKNTCCIPLGFPAGWLLQAFSIACFFWSSVRENPERRTTRVSLRSQVYLFSPVSSEYVEHTTSFDL